MLADHADLIEFGINLSPEAVARAEEFDTCAVCRAPELPHGSSQAVVMEWLERFDPEEAQRLRKGIIGESVGERSGGAIDSPLTDSYVITSRAFAGSKLRLGVAVPITILEGAICSGNWTFDEFLPENHLELICDRCSHSLTLVEEVAPRFFRIYVNRRFDGNEAAALAQPSASTVRNLVALIESVARRFAISA